MGFNLFLTKSAVKQTQTSDVDAAKTQKIDNFKPFQEDERRRRGKKNVDAANRSWNNVDAAKVIETDVDAAKIE